MAANARRGSRKIRARDSLERSIVAAMMKSPLLLFAHSNLHIDRCGICNESHEMLD